MVKEITGPGYEFQWDGTDESGALVDDGGYLFEITATSTRGGAGQTSYYGVVTVDISVPGRSDENHELVPAGAYIASVAASSTEDVTPFRESRLVTVVY